MISKKIINSIINLHIMTRLADKAVNRAKLQSTCPVSSRYGQGSEAVAPDRTHSNYQLTLTFLRDPQKLLLHSLFSNTEQAFPATTLLKG